MTNLKSTIEDLATEFALSIIGALRSASIDELTAVAAGGGTRARVSRAAVADTAGPSAASAGPGRPARRGRAGRLARRSPADIGKMLDSIVELLQEHPEGLRSEQIRAALNCRKNELPRPLADGLAQGLLSKKGEKRATTYFAGKGGGGGAKAADAGAPKKRGRRKKG